MKVMVTGGTGFVGGEILKELIEQGHEPLALVRENTEKGLSAIPPNVELARADVLDPELEKYMQGIDAVIHLVGIIRAFPKKGVTFDKLHTEQSFSYSLAKLIGPESGECPGDHDIFRQDPARNRR